MYTVGIENEELGMGNGNPGALEMMNFEWGITMRGNTEQLEVGTLLGYLKLNFRTHSQF
jgi:hypothetical protein